MPAYTFQQILADYSAAAEIDPGFAPEYQRALAQYGQEAADSQGLGMGASGKAGMEGGSAQNRLWGSLPEQARRKWPHGLGALAGGIVLLFWVRKKLRQAVPDQSSDGDQ